MSTSLPKVIWEEGRLAALSDTYAVKSPLVTMVRLKFAPKSAPSGVPIRKPHYLPHPWTRPTYDAKRHPDPIRRFSQCTGQTDRPTDRPRKSLTTIGRCATRATWPNNTCTFVDCCIYCRFYVDVFSAARLTVVGGLGFTAILSIYRLFFFRPYPRSSLNGTQPKPATCSEVTTT